MATGFVGARLRVIGTSYSGSPASGLLQVVSCGSVARKQSGGNVSVVWFAAEGETLSRYLEVLS